MDGQAYDVWIEFDSMERSFDFVEGQNAGFALDGTDIDDTIGTRYGYSMTVKPNPNNRGSYDYFFEAISSPNRKHVVTLPYNQSIITFECKVLAGRDKFKGMQGASQLWDGLSVQFIPIKPQRSSI